ncbi:MAG TPA: oligosaccharide flippase family protein, partial [Gaiellaceae bacterium]|nr:oligosaccharide flippase family protein [Gaiellaceae bacterium]
MRSTIGSLIAAVAGQGGLVISGVFAARLLGPKDRGYLALVMLIPLALTYAGSLGLPLSATYYIARRRGAAAAIVRRLRPALVVQSLVLVALQAVAVALLLPSSRLAAGLITLVFIPAVLSQQYALGILQGRQRFAAFNIVRVVPVFLYAFGVAVLYAIDYADVAAVAAAWTIAYVIAAVVALVAALRHIEDDPQAEPPSVREMTRFGCRGLLGSTSPIEAFRIDQAFVGLALSPTALGYYVVAYAFTNFPRLASQSIGMIAYPAVADVKDPRAARRLGTRFL